MKLLVTGCAYGIPDTVPITEDTPPAADQPQRPQHRRRSRWRPRREPHPGNAPDPARAGGDGGPPAGGAGVWRQLPPRWHLHPRLHPRVRSRRRPCARCGSPGDDPRRWRQFSAKPISRPTDFPLLHEVLIPHRMNVVSIKIF